MNIFVFLCGLILGSFINASMLKYDTNTSSSRRSRCFSCGKRLSWYELFPVVSWVIQKGRCRTCLCTIPWRYPLVELVCGFLLVGMWSVSLLFDQYQLIVFGYFTLFASVMYAMALYDIDTMYIPSELLYATAVLCCVPLVTTLYVSPQDHMHILGYIGGLLFGGGLLFFVWVLSKKKSIGFGDVLLIAPLGLFFGLQKTLILIFIMSWSGMIFVCLWYIAYTLSLKGIVFKKQIKKPTRKTKLPLVPFIMFGWYCTLVFYQEIVEIFFLYLQ